MTRECGVSANSIAIALAGLPNLVSLSVQGCPGVTTLHPDHRAVVALEARVAAKPSRPTHNLSTLTLGGCRRLAGATLAAFVRWCSRIHDLNLAECEGLSDQDLTACLPLLPTLHVINLSKLASLRAIDQVVQSMSRACRNLIYVNLSGNLGLTDGEPPTCCVPSASPP